MRTSKFTEDFAAVYSTAPTLTAHSLESQTNQGMLRPVEKETRPYGRAESSRSSSTKFDQTLRQVSDGMVDAHKLESSSSDQSIPSATIPRAGKSRRGSRIGRIMDTCAAQVNHYL